MDAWIHLIHQPNCVQCSVQCTVHTIVNIHQSNKIGKLIPKNHKSNPYSFFLTMYCITYWTKYCTLYCTLPSNLKCTLDTVHCTLYLIIYNWLMVGWCCFWENLMLTLYCWWLLHCRVLKIVLQTKLFNILYIWYCKLYTVYCIWHCTMTMYCTMTSQWLAYSFSTTIVSDSCTIFW